MESSARYRINDTQRELNKDPEFHKVWAVPETEREIREKFWDGHWDGPCSPPPYCTCTIEKSIANLREIEGTAAKFLTNYYRWDVWERDNFTCQWCGVRRDLSVDHIVPRSKLGATTLDNLQTLCRSCNSKKRDRL